MFPLPLFGCGSLKHVYPAKYHTRIFYTEQRKIREAGRRGQGW